MASLHQSVAGLFGEVFGALYPDGMLHRKVRGAEDAGGSALAAFTGDAGEAPGDLVKVQLDSVTQAMREAEGYAEQDVRLIILSRYAGSGLPDPVTGDHVTALTPGGTRYSLEGPIIADAARSHWQVRARPVR